MVKNSLLASQKVNRITGISLVVQWLKTLYYNAGGPGSTPGQGTRSHMLQLKRPCMPQLKIPCATTDPVQPNKQTREKQHRTRTVHSQEHTLKN